MTALHLAVLAGDAAVVEFLLLNEAHPIALDDAVRGSCRQCVRLSLIRPQGHDPIYYAKQAGLFRIPQLLTYVSARLFFFVW